MFRRIELIESAAKSKSDFKHGLCGLSLHPKSMEIFEAWTDIPQVPKYLYKNCRFYFTEAGWKKFGSNTIDACKRINQKFRIITIKEKSVDVFYKDEYQVAIRPRRKMNQKHYKIAKENIKKLWKSKPFTKNGDLLDLLINVVDEYENRYNVMDFSPLEIVRNKMKESGLKQIDLANIFGGKNRVSEFFSGKSQLTFKTIKKLHFEFGIPYEPLIGNYDFIKELSAKRILLDTNNKNGPKRILVDTL